MPIYNFKCPDCGHSFDELMSWTQRSKGTVECPACKAIINCNDAAQITAPGGIVFGGKFTDLTKWQKHNDALKKKNK